MLAPVHHTGRLGTCPNSCHQQRSGVLAPAS